ncbi:purine/pyrimidine permease, partial [Bacillus pumilus]|uniref:purine/pyrimidine permease n=1 Tax=Bacillus pumilus TaxID=1408 RepID=UPI0016434FC7
QLNQLHSPHLIQTTFFSLPLLPILQSLSPHILPINQSPPGLSWPLYTLYPPITPTIFPTYPQTLQPLQPPLIFTPPFFFIFS